MRAQTGLEIIAIGAAAGGLLSFVWNAFRSWRDASKKVHIRVKDGKGGFIEINLESKKDLEELEARLKERLAHKGSAGTNTKDSPEPSGGSS